MRSAAQLFTLASTLCLKLVLLAAGLMAIGSDAHAERPITGYIEADPTLVEPIDPLFHNSKIIFLNRCAGGCTITGGSEDSRTNSSSIFRSGSVQISEWNKGDEQWKELVACVSAMYDPYDLTITDVDPGPNVAHFEAIVAGTASEIGASPQIGGIAPFLCGGVNNAITFSFANSSFYANGVASICETVGQETAHAFGLEHEYLCSDPMTYLPECGLKWFQDENASCGEYEAASCSCGPNQNSHRRLTNHFGPGANPGPKLGFVRPKANTNVTPNFVIEVSANDYWYGVSGVEVFINGESIGTTSSPPYIFNAPDGIDGITTLEVRGTDMRGYEGTSTVEINVGEQCEPGGCAAGRVCYKGYCIADATSEGGFGATCTRNEGCNSRVCAVEDGVGSCTGACELDNGDCPAQYGCLKAGTTNVCWAGVVEGEESGGCGCQAGQSGGGLAGLFLVLLGLMVQRRRRG